MIKASVLFTAAFVLDQEHMTAVAGQETGVVHVSTTGRDKLGWDCGQ